MGERGGVGGFGGTGFPACAGGKWRQKIHLSTQPFPFEWERKVLLAQAESKCGRIAKHAAIFIFSLFIQIYASSMPDTIRRSPHLGPSRKESRFLGPHERQSGQDQAKGGKIPPAQPLTPGARRRLPGLALPGPSLAVYQKNDKSRDGQ